MCGGVFFLTTSTSVGPRAPAGRPGSRQSGRWPHPAGLGHQKFRPGLDRPKSPRAARGPAGLLRPLERDSDVPMYCAARLSWQLSSSRWLRQLKTCIADADATQCTPPATPASA
jgi:hypothetical protein